MSTPNPATITYEQMMALFLETREQMRETDRIVHETAQNLENSRLERERERENDRQEWLKRAERLDREISRHGDRLGELVSSMVEGGILRLFKDLGYEFNIYSRRMAFGDPTIKVYGEVDFFLENGDFALLVEVKTNLSIDKVKEHLECLEKFRAVADVRKDKRRFIAAVGGGVVRENVRDFALKQGMYVIQQSGENVEVIPPDGKPKIW